MYPDTKNFLKAYSQMSKKLYIIQADKYIKIGISTRPNHRIKDLQIACPIKLKLRWTKDIPKNMKDIIVESECHKALREFHARGEWFECSTQEAIDVCEYITSLNPLELCELVAEDATHFKDGGKAHKKRIKRMADMAEEASKLRKTMSDEIEITKNNIDLLLTRCAGIKKATLLELGESWPPVRGWKNRILGKHINRRFFSVDPQNS